MTRPLQKNSVPTLFPRQLLEPIRKSKKSVLLLGPRQCGKSTLIRQCEPALTINLARESEFAEFSSNPSALEERIQAERPRTVFIDEVQRIPSILNTVQALIDEGGERAPKFYLTGSSARKLKRGHGNLLPGRVAVFQLAPLHWQEFGDRSFSIAQLLSIGTLPGILSQVSSGASPLDFKKTLLDYSGTYLREEIQAEALARDIGGFSRFLRVAAGWVGDFIDVSKMASQSQIKRLTALRYFDILEDTLIVTRLESFAPSGSRRLIQHPKLYFFDVGVWNAVAGGFDVSQDRIGKLFEHFIFNQLSHAAKARDEVLRISTYRTENAAEVDLIVERGGRLFALDIKASKNIAPGDLRGLQSFQKYVGTRKVTPLIAYLGTTPRRIEGIDVLPWATALNHIFE